MYSRHLPRSKSSCCGAGSVVADSRPGTQVSGLTRLMMEGKKDEAGGAGGRRENRRETWAPGIAGGAALSMAADRLFAVRPKPSTAPSPCCAACPNRVSRPLKCAWLCAQAAARASASCRRPWRRPRRAPLLRQGPARRPLLSQSTRPRAPAHPYVGADAACSVRAPLLRPPSLLMLCFAAPSQPLC